MTGTFAVHRDGLDPCLVSDDVAHLAAGLPAGSVSHMSSG